MSATSYLPRRWPSKYFRLNESLRPCSGWERVFSSRLVTDESVFAISLLISSVLSVRWKLHKKNISFVITFLLSTCAIIDCFAHFALAPLATVVILNLNSTTCSSCSSTSRRRCLVPFIMNFRKSPRPISIRRLKMLPFLHLGPINVVICNGTY